MNFGWLFEGLSVPGLAGFWGPVVATAAMGLGVLIGYLILVGSRRLAPANPSTEKNRTYGCGEIVKAEETQANAEEFYSPIKEVFGGFYEYIRPGHSGKLNSYLVWVMAGFVIILLWIGIQLG